jgi:hypothetical protein
MVRSSNINHLSRTVTGNVTVLRIRINFTPIPIPNRFQLNAVPDVDPGWIHTFSGLIIREKMEEKLFFFVSLVKLGRPFFLLVFHETVDVEPDSHYQKDH